MWPAGICTLSVVSSQLCASGSNWQIGDAKKKAFKKNSALIGQQYDEAYMTSDL